MPRAKLDKSSPTVRVQLVTTARWITRVRKWAKAQEGNLSDSAAIRALVNQALEEEK